MRNRALAVIGLVACLSGSAGFFGGRALAAAEPKSHYESDVADLDRTEKYLCGHLSTAVQTLKRIASETTPENAETEKQARETAIGAALQPFQEDSFILLLQTHFLALDNLADKGGEPVEQFLKQALYPKLELTPEEVLKHRESSGLGHGGLILAHLVARISKTPVEKVLEDKKNRAWPEVMRLHKVTAGQIGFALEDK
ncbi:MAG: hypothetical protein ACK47B_12725 [Armatimonadota bacterium]